MSQDREAHAWNCHVLPSSHFDAIAEGKENPATIRVLLKTERSRRLLLLRTLLDDVALTPAALGPLPPAKAAWDLLAAAQRQHPAQFDIIVLHPHIGTWIAHSLRRLHGTADGHAPLWVDIGHLFAVACAVAVATDVPFQTRVPLRDGTVMFPRLGFARLPVSEPWAMAEAEVQAGRVTLSVSGHKIVVHPTEVIHPAERDTPSWWALRQLRSRAAGRELVICLDDVDPYRNLSSPILADRLDSEQARRWQRLLDDAWSILASDDLAAAETLAAGLQSVVPLPPSSRWEPRSASSGEAFGAALVSSPPDGTMLAALLVHEFQHTKLGGLYHLVKLFQDDGKQRFYAPWRDDPRPLGGLLQGIYAFLGVTGFWRLRRRATTGPVHDLATFEFALWRLRTWRALQVLRADDGLTALGRRFASGLAERMRPWWADRVPPQLAAAARTAAFDHWIGWRLRHLRPDAEWVSNLADAWSRSSPPVWQLGQLGQLGETTLVPGIEVPWSAARISLVRQRLAGPGSGNASESSDRDLAPADLTPADVALIDGRHGTAVEAYAAHIAAGAQNAEAWSGFLLALATADPTAQVLLRRPELVQAAYRESRCQHADPDPRPLANWLCGLLVGMPPAIQLF